MEPAFQIAKNRNSEQSILLLLGAANDAIQELQISGVKATSYQQQTLFLTAASPATRVWCLVQVPLLQAKIHHIYQRRSGQLLIKKIRVRIRTS